MRLSKGADYRYIPRQRFAALSWYQCEPVGPLAVESGKADGLLGYGNACCGYGTGNNVIDGLMPGYFTRGLLTHRAVNPLCIDERPTSTGMGDTDAAALPQGHSHMHWIYYYQTECLLQTNLDSAAVLVGIGSPVKESFD